LTSTWIDVDQVTRLVALVAQSCRAGGADGQAGDRVAVGQGRQAPSGQHPAHRACRDASDGGDVVAAGAQQPPGGLDASLHLDRSAVRAGVRAGGAVLQSCFAVSDVPVDPAVRALARHTQLLSHVRDGPAVAHDALDQ
jgi:hypothetical protein